MKKLLLTLLLASSLVGCIPTAIVVGATAGGAIIYDKRSFKQMRSDQEAENTAQYWINKQVNAKNRGHISVTVFNQIGLMVGQAQNAQLRTKAYSIMTRVKNIKRVYNAVIIAGPTSTLQRTSDSLITGKVRSTLLTTSGLKSNDIKIVTEDGVVYLLGNISRQQADLAARKTRHVSGVTKVVKVFEYT